MDMNAPLEQRIAEHQELVRQYEEHEMKAPRLMAWWKVTPENVIREKIGNTHISRANPPLMTYSPSGEREVFGMGSSPENAYIALGKAMEEISFRGGSLSRHYSPPLNLLKQQL